VWVCPDIFASNTRDEGAKYHITARGSGGRRIFAQDDDRGRFLEQLEYALDTAEVILYAYVLMGTHYHLLIETPRGNVAAFEHRLNTAYSVYYRFKHQWRGHVLQSRYGSKLVQGDTYLLAVTRYIHLNPVKTAIMRRSSEEQRLEYLRSYKWSSYRGYIQKQHEEQMVNYRWRELLGIASESWRRTRYRKYVERFVTENDDKTIAGLQLSPSAIGEEEFIAEIEDEMRARRTGTAKDADMLWPRVERPAPQAVEVEVSREFGMKVKDLCNHARRVGPAKAVLMELVCRLSGLTQREAGQRYGGITCAAVGHLRRKIRLAMDEDSTLRERVERLERMLTKALAKL
jgi:putative transposase